MNQATTQQGIINLARQGQMMMNEMKGNALSNNDREEYSRYFKVALDGGLMTGNGSGSGGTKATESVKDFLNHLGDNAFQWWIDGKLDNLYDSTEAMAEIFKDHWLYGEYKENQGKDFNQRQKDYDLIYGGQASKDKITEDLKGALKKRYPSAANLIDGKLDTLLADMKKNPNKYGDASAGELAQWALDRLLGADSSYTNEQFEKDLEHINNCYVEKCKYVQLDKKGKLEQKFNASNPGEIAQAARIAAKDYVYNIGTTEYWAKGKKEALEAEGGVVNVLQNAVRSTLNIPDDVDITYQWKMDEQHNDITSTPIFTVNNKNYQVVPNDDDSGFKLAVINPGTETRDINGKVYEVGKNGELKEVEYIEGTVKDYKSIRKDEKIKKKQEQKESQIQIANINRDREKKINDLINESKTMPKAMMAAGKVEKDDWETISTVDVRIEKLNMTETAINSDARKVKAKKMTEAEFKAEYNIDYSEWIKNYDRSAHYELILKS